MAGSLSSDDHARVPSPHCDATHATGSHDTAHEGGGAAPRYANLALKSPAEEQNQVSKIRLQCPALSDGNQKGTPERKGAVSFAYACGLWKFRGFNDSIECKPGIMGGLC